MKKVTFDKATEIRLGQSHGYTHRLDFPGYLLTHSDHPGREFVVARSSTSPPYDFLDWSFTTGWSVYDRVTGIRINGTKRKTRAEAVEAAIWQLSHMAPKDYDERVREVQITRAKKILERGT